MPDQSQQRQANKVYPIRSNNSEVGVNKKDVVKKEKSKHKKGINQRRANQSKTESEPDNKSHSLDRSGSDNDQSGPKHPEIGAGLYKKPQQPMTDNHLQQPLLSGFNAGLGGRRP